jgi:hypothetical protein
VRREILLPVLLLGVLVAEAAADAAPDVGLVVFHGPASPSPAAAAARDRAAASARDARRAWLDLSPSPPPSPIAPERLRAGVDAYEELRWDVAKQAFDEAIDEAAATGGAGLTTAELSDAFLYRGLVHTQRGDTTAAWDDLVRAATIVPSRTLDPLRFPTRAIEAFDRARAAVAALTRAKVTVEAPGCEVWIDGGAGASAELPPGDHFVRAVCPGRAPWGQRVAVAGDTSVTPAFVEPAPPDDAALGALARERGVSEVLAVVVAESGTASPTAALRIVDAAGVASRGSSVALDGDAGLAALDDALDDALAAPIVVAPPPPRQRWWKSPWLWAGVAAAATAAVILPLTLGDEGGGDDATLRPTGWRW